jgi:GH18 family chitinase
MDVQASKEVSVSGNMIGSTWTAKYPKDALVACDIVNLMAYDDDYNIVGQHAPEDMAKSQTNLYGTFVGASTKIAMGVPFYGKQGFNNRRDFKVIAAQNNPPPSADVAGGYYYNGPDMLGRKMAYTITNNNAGIMIWDLIKDAADFRLLKAINASVKANNAVLDQKPRPNSVRFDPTASRSVLRALGGDLVMPAGALSAVGSSMTYRLTLSAPDGREVGTLLSRPGAAGSTVWSLPGLPTGSYLYKVEGKTGDISGALRIRK